MQMQSLLHSATSLEIPTTPHSNYYTLEESMFDGYRPYRPRRGGNKCNCDPDYFGGTSCTQEPDAPEECLRCWAAWCLAHWPIVGPAGSLPRTRLIMSEAMQRVLSWKYP